MQLNTPGERYYKQLKSPYLINRLCRDAPLTCPALTYLITFCKHHCWYCNHHCLYHFCNYVSSSLTGSAVCYREALPKAEQQPAMTAMQDPDRPTPPGVVVVPIATPQPHTDTTALFQSSGLIRNKAALTAIGDSCGCMEYGYTRFGSQARKLCWTKSLPAVIESRGGFSHAKFACRLLQSLLNSTGKTGEVLLGICVFGCLRFGQPCSM